MTAMPVSLLDWKPMVKNTLRGFAGVRIGQSLIVRDVPVHCFVGENGGRRWASLPSKPVLGKDGNAVRDEKGKIKYAPILEWADRGASDRFSEAVIDAVEREHPGATGSDAVG